MACRAMPTTSPRPAEDGDGAYRCMQAALKRAGIAAGDIDYVNAHGTSTPLGDEIELGAVERLMGNRAERPRHVLDQIGDRPSARRGRARSRRYFRILAMRDGIAPPTFNLENPSVETDIDLVPLKPRHKEINTVLSNSFGFGGTNASLIFRACA